MARWQRGRRGRGKPPEHGSEQKKPEQALQPIYPDMESVQPVPKPPAPETPPQSVPQPTGDEGPQGAGRSRRRRRGGRGRGRRDTPSPMPRQPGIPATSFAGEAEQARPGKHRGQPVRGGREQLHAPLAPQYPPERYDQAATEVAPDLPAAHPRPHAAATQRKPRGTVVLTIGLPGSGKSSWFKRRGVTPLSSDLLRTLLFDNITEQRYQDLVFSTLRSLLRARLIAGMPWNYIDATNLSPKERQGWIKMAREFGYETHAVFFDVPLEVCMERNLRRARIVPEDVMRRMAAKLRPPRFEEGFAKVIVVRVKRSDQEAQPEEAQPAE